jgi:hypothetical protein
MDHTIYEKAAPERRYLGYQVPVSATTGIVITIA